ncbi:conjugal transfer protein TraF [Vibrio sp. NTOU-M3]|uniref:conjugal transfer protein TraF n=1 Tax=Vibrio sp. NTOU-M3 TaxID=3234954 RepID=UPI00349F0867
MILKRKLSIAVVAAIVSTSTLGATTVADGRGNGMGNTGVTTADYVLAPFYNPALTAVYREKDTVGILFPAIGARARDTDESLDTIDSLQDTISSFENGNTDPATIATLNGYLDQLADDAPLGISAGAGFAVALPIQNLSINLYGRGYAEIVASTEIAANGGNTPLAVQARYENSEVDMIAFGYTEYGVAMAKRLTLMGQDVSLGVTPKYQQLRTYKQALSVEDFDLSDYDQSETKKNAFNLDLGAIWFYEQFRAGVAIKDLFSKTLDTQNFGGVSQYKLNTQVTASGAYVTELLTATVDMDLTKQSRFTDLDDDTQFLRFGVEANAWGWAQVRAGYEVDLKSTLDNSLTAGVGISPGDLVSLDLAGSYAGDNQFGLSGNLAFTF